jgi:hypothetical protein
MDMDAIVGEVQAIVDDGTRVPGFRNRLMVDVDRLSALENMIQTSIPASVREAATVIAQKESIVNQAYLEAQRMKKAAEQEASGLAIAAQEEHQAKVDESTIVASSQAKAEQIQGGAMTEAQQITQDAQRKAYRLLSEAEASAQARIEGADQYAREVLFGLEERMSETLSQVRRGIDSLKTEELVQARANGGRT